MKSILKRVIVYDIETGGLAYRYNSITEFAGVAIDLETLEIIEEFSVMFKPRVDLNFRTDPRKDAKMIFKNLAEKDEATNIKTINFKGDKITLKSVKILEEAIQLFYEFLDETLDTHMNIFDYEDWLELYETSHKDIAEIFFLNCYNPGAEAVTHITVDMLLEEGLKYDEAFEQIHQFIERHTNGNSRPIIAGHNIKDFDNDYMIKLFEAFKYNFFNCVNSYMIDTIDWARTRWSELANFQLGTCANEVGLTLKEAHRALPDTVANAKFLIKMIQNLRGEGSQQSTYKRRKLKMNF